VNDRERFRKDDPKRSHPRRNITEALRNEDPWKVRPQANGSRRFARPDLPPDEAPGEGVDDAYRVADDQMREGQWRARWRNPAGPDWRGYGSPYGGGGYGGGYGGRPGDGMVEQMTRVYLDMMSLVGSMINGVVRAPYPGPRFDGPRESPFDGYRPDREFHQGSYRREFGRRERATAVRVEVTSSQRNQVVLDLKPLRTGVSLIVSPLRTMNKGAGEILEVQFEATPDRCVLKVQIPDHQVSGLYSGVVADGSSGEPYGTISIQVEGQQRPRVHPQRSKS
jgi:hypothetical protein